MGVGSGSCPTSLSYLSGAIPACSAGSEVERIREIGLATNVVQVIGRVRAQGMPISKAINLANQQADAAHSNLASLEDGIAKASSRGQESVKRLLNNDWGGCGGGRDVLSTLTDAWIAATIQEIINREVAKQMAQCVASASNP